MKPNILKCVHMLYIHIGTHFFWYCDVLLGPLKHFSYKVESIQYLSKAVWFSHSIAISGVELTNT